MKARFSLIFAFCIAAPFAGAQEPAALRPWYEDMFLQGKFTFDLRLRYEFAEESGRDASHAATARTRLGYGTKAELPISGYIELEDIRAARGSAYNQAGLNNQPNKTVIADPEITELNQAYVNLRHDYLSARLGRQRIILDNHRFVGNVGWRQNEQTFDAATLKYQPADDTSILYSYVDQVNRVFGREHPMGRWNSDSHLINFLHPLPLPGKAGTYLYLLRFREAPASSADTFGLWIRPTLDFLPMPTTLHLEAAYQRDNSASLEGADFSHTYFRSEIESRFEHFTAGGGFERLGGDRTTAFQTPLATLHAFNGWADQFLVTPAAGLNDIFVFVSAPLPGKITGRVNAHHFSSHRGSSTYGHELGLQVTRPLTAHASALAKAALFDGKSGRPDVTKVWVQTEIKF
jgi:hypothetical protein